MSRGLRATASGKPFAMSRSPLILVLLVAMCLRAVAALGLEWTLEGRQQRFLFGDSEGYWILAEQIRQGKPYEFGAPEASVVRMPGFPLLLAGVFLLFGDEVLAARLVMVLLGTLACGLLYALGRQQFDDRVGLVAAVGAAVYPTFVLFSCVVLSETWFVVLMLANLIWLARVVDPPQKEPPRARGGHAGHKADWEAFVGGILAGAATYVRPSWILFGPLVLAIRVAVGPHRKEGLRQTFFLLLGMIVMLSPWWVRNYRVTGRFVPTTLWVGASLYDGLNPSATGGSDMRFLDEVKAKRLGEYAQDRYLRREALRLVREDPQRALELAGVKLLRYWSPWPHAEQFQSWQAGLVLLFSYGPALTLAGIGLWRHRRLGGTRTLLVLPILYFCMVHLVFVSSIRYRLPGMYPILILAAAALVRPGSSKPDESGRASLRTTEDGV